jgi:hypothetical protein
VGQSRGNSTTPGRRWDGKDRLLQELLECAMTGSTTVPRSRMFADFVQGEQWLPAECFLKLLPGDLQAMAEHFVRAAIYFE